MRGMLVLVGVMAPAAVASAGPRGKVVRVERERPEAGPPVICYLEPSELKGMCLGPQPKKGDVMVVFDTRRAFAEVELDTVQPFAETCNAMWQISGRLRRGQLTGQRPLAVIDPSLDPRLTRHLEADNGRLASPSSEGDSRVVLGIDRNGDDIADIVVLQSRCEQSTSTGTECFEFWTRSSLRRAKGGMTRVWTANLQACFP
jgi:hypothetical protein